MSTDMEGVLANPGVVKVFPKGPEAVIFDLDGTLVRILRFGNSECSL